MNRLQELRKAAGLTQEALARKADLTLSGVRQLETGRRRPRPRTAQAIATALGREVAEVWPPEAIRSA